jgi:hypothetical protein
MSFALLILDKINKSGSSDFAAWHAMSAVEIGELLTMARAETRNPPGLQKNYRADVGIFLTLRQPAHGGTARLVPVVVEEIDGTIGIGFTGFNEHAAPAGIGRPVRLDIHDNEPRVLIWGDINQEDPTHTVSLAGAADRQRKEGG